jgi:hypothetical protein
VRGSDEFRFVLADEVAQRCYEFLRVPEIMPPQGGTDVVHDHVPQLICPTRLLQEVLGQRRGGHVTMCSCSATAATSASLRPDRAMQSSRVMFTVPFPSLKPLQTQQLLSLAEFPVSPLLGFLRATSALLGVPSFTEAESTTVALSPLQRSCPFGAATALRGSISAARQSLEPLRDFSCWTSSCKSW